MAIEDKVKWDKKYVEKTKLLEPREASQNLKNYISECNGKTALELACGSGRNSIYLAQNGFKVDAYDIAELALSTLNNYATELNIATNIKTHLSDLDNESFQENIYDLVVMTNFLDRNLIEKVKKSLQSGALFFVETYMQDSANNKPNANQDYLLKVGELKEIFSNFETLFYDEFDNEESEMYQMKKQVIVAKKI